MNFYTDKYIRQVLQLFPTLSYLALIVKVPFFVVRV